jgi:D-inositol-3-phosphate glycosyltransferase
VDLDHFKPLDRAMAKANIVLLPTQKLLLFVGRIEPLKGVDTLLRAVALIARKNPELCGSLVLAIIGGDPDETPQENAEMSRLMALRQELGLHNLVTFLGAKDQNRLRQYYNAAEALIMPSDYESFGMVALEAMACGTPVIASEVGGLAYLVRDGQNGFHVPVREPVALAERITSLLKTPTLRQELGCNALHIAQDYAWPTVADRLLAIFATLPAPIKGWKPQSQPPYEFTTSDCNASI